MRLTNVEIMEKAKQFVKFNLVVLCSELLHYYETGMPLNASSKVAELRGMLPFIGSSKQQVVESIIKSAAMEKVVSDSLVKKNFAKRTKRW